MFGIRTWRALRRRGVMGINQRNGDYVLAYNDRRLYPLVDDKIRTKKLALDAGIQVPDMYGIIDTEQGISKLQHIVETHGDFVIKPAQGAGGDGKKSLHRSKHTLIDTLDTCAAFVASAAGVAE